MNIRASLLADRSKENCERIVRYIEANPAAMNEYMDCLLKPDFILNQRAAWVLHFFTDHLPSAISSWQWNLLEKCQSPGNHDAVKRAIVRHWAEYGFPEGMEGEVYNLCFGYLEGQEPIAVKAHAMYACLRVVNKYPELKNELMAVILAILDKYGKDSPGLKNRGEKVSHLLKKL